MKIKRTVIEKAVRKAYKEGRQWARRDWGYVYRIMIDTEDVEIWCDNFISCNEWKVYQSETIKHLTSGGLTVKETEENMVTEAIDILEEAGWEIEN